MKIKSLLVALAIAVLALMPISPAQATHNCGFDPCPHPGDLLGFLCDKFAVLEKYGLCVL